MSEARRRRRAMEKQLGFKKPSNPLSKEALELRARKIRAGKEVHRQNLERSMNSDLKKEAKKESTESQEGISLNSPSMDDLEFSLDSDPFGFLSSDTTDEVESK